MVTIGNREAVPHFKLGQVIKNTLSVKPMDMTVYNTKSRIPWFGATHIPACQINITRCHHLVALVHTDLLDKTRGMNSRQTNRQGLINWHAVISWYGLLAWL